MDVVSKVFTWQNAASLTAVYLSTVAFYRLFLSPLAKFPGPKLAAIIRYYEAYYDVVQDGQYEKQIALMHEKYGPIVRVSPHELHIKDSSYYEKLFRTDGRWNKYDWAVTGHNAPGATIFTADHDLHRFRRIPLNTFFSKAKVARHMDVIRPKVNRVGERVGEVQGTGKTIDLGAVISGFMRDISTEFVLGKNYHNLDMDDFGLGTTLFMHGGGKMWRTTKHLPWYSPLILSMPREFLIKNSGDEGMASFFRYVIASENETERLREAATNPNTDGESFPPNIVHEIIQSNLPAEDKSVQRIFSDVVTVTGAGFETSASVLRLIVYSVWSDAKILGQLRAELAKARAGSRADEPWELRTLENLPYLTAILMEGMRLSPALGTRLQRVAPDRDLTYNEWVIPAGTPVGMTTLDMHYDATHYPEPKRFVPERWMEEDARKKKEKVYAPFSRGSRNCLGMHLAWAVLYLAVAELAEKFDFDFQGVPDDHFEIESDQFIIATKGKASLPATVTAYSGSAV